MVQGTNGNCYLLSYEINGTFETTRYPEFKAGCGL
jgi:hypothetical protein